MVATGVLNKQAKQEEEKVCLEKNAPPKKPVEPVKVAPTSQQNQILIDGPSSSDPIMLKSLRMVEKFEGSPTNKSIDIDAQSASSNDFQIEADVDKDETEPSPVIKSEAPKEQLQTAPKPTDDKVLLQQKCQALIEALNDDCNKQPAEQKKAVNDKQAIKLSEIDLVAKQKILYL